MRDGAAERRFGGRAFRVDMDELMVVGGIGELVDHALRDLAPGRQADLLADAGQKLLQVIGFKLSSPCRPIRHSLNRVKPCCTDWPPSIGRIAPVT